MNPTILPQPTIITLINNEINKLKSNLDDLKDIREYKFSSNNVVELFNEEDILKEMDKSSIGYLLYEELKFIQTEIAKEIACYKRIFHEFLKNIEEEDITDSEVIEVSVVSDDIICHGSLDSKNSYLGSHINKSNRDKVVSETQQINIQKQINCPICHKLFRSVCQMKKHLLIHNNSSKTSSFNVDGKRTKNIVTLFNDFCNTKETVPESHSREVVEVAGKKINFVQEICKKPLDLKNVHPVNSNMQIMCLLPNNSHVSWTNSNLSMPSVGPINVASCSPNKTAQIEDEENNSKNVVKENEKCNHGINCNKPITEEKRIHAHDGKDAVKLAEISKVCTICDKVFSNETKLADHHKDHVGKINIFGKYTCNVCNKFLKTPKMLIRHLTLHREYVPKSFKCDLCSQDFTTKYFYNKHRSKTHGRKNNFVCEFCNKSYLNKIYFDLHMENHKKIWKCNVCEKLFKNKPILMAHKKIHTIEMPFQCEICGKRFKFHQNAKSHALIHTGVRSIKCQYCPKHFLTRRRCDLHERIHTGDRRYLCEICSKSFTRKSDLNAHTRKHNGTSSPHQCNICHKSFSSASYLVGHERLHTGEKPFNCKVCGKAFNLKGHAKKHELWHAMQGKKLFVCDICDKSFDNRSGLQCHKRVHASIKRYKCGICNKPFVTKSQVQRHLKNHNTNDLDNYFKEG